MSSSSTRPGTSTSRRMLSSSPSRGAPGPRSCSRPASPSSICPSPGGADATSASGFPELCRPHPDTRDLMAILRAKIEVNARTLLEALGAAASAQPAWPAAALDPTWGRGAATGGQPPLAGSGAFGGLLPSAPVLMPRRTLGAGPSPGEVVGSTSYTGNRGSPSLAGFQVQEAKGDVFMGVADESARFLRDTEASRIGSLTLDQLEADLRWLAHSYLNQPLAELFFPTVQLRNTVFALVERNRYPEQVRQLYLIAGQACLLLAKASKDFGSLAAADTHARTAWLCAELADHHDLRAWVRGYQALSAYWDGRPADAVRFVEGGQRFPARGSAALLLPSLHARAAGLMSDTRAITAALVAGDAAGEQTQPDDL